jgi:PIN domain nuclease of toxin-antitoxin system
MCCRSPTSRSWRRTWPTHDFQILPILPKHTALLTTLPLHHKDPFDRLLVAQALSETIPLVSADAQLDPYGVNRHW